MECAQAGDALAYERLLFELVRYARQKVSYDVRDASAREDIVQNALLSVHRSRHTYRSEHAFEPWFNTILRHAMVDWYRTVGRRRALELRIEEAPAEALVATSSEESPRSLPPELADALAQLPPKQRQAVELIHVEGLSVNEAAARAHVTPGALKVRAHRGYRALRALLRRPS